MAQLAHLLSLVSSRTEEIERARCLPSDLVAELGRAGCLRMFAPSAYAGDDVDLPEALRVIEALAQVDGSTGWSIAQVCLAQLIFALFPAETVAHLYADGPDLFGAGAVAPKGRARREEGGWRVVGQWPFVTGCNQASWIYLNCVVLEGRALKRLPNGMPATRMMLFPAADIEVLNTWRSVGLCGTASHDVRIHHRFCPHERSYAPLPIPEETDRAAMITAQAGLLVAAAAVGIAQGALNEVSALAASGRRPAFSTTRLSESVLFQNRFGEATMVLRAARALLYSEATAVGAQHEEEHQPRARALLRAAAAQTITLATTAADSAYALGGGASVFASSPLQRRLRDIHTATQHFVAGREFYSVLGALLVGGEVDGVYY